jgi:MarR family transcriptional regulator, organic hydroperoxide resistance regulator
MDGEKEFVVELLRTGAFLIREGGRIADWFGLSQQQLEVLRAIAEHPGETPLTQKQLRLELMYEKSNISKAVSRLISMGYVTAEASPRDGRARHLRVTPQGAEVASRGMEAFDAWTEDWLKGVGQGRLRQAAGLLRSLRERVPELVR